MESMSRMKSRQPGWGWGGKEFCRLAHPRTTYTDIVRQQMRLSSLGAPKGSAVPKHTSVKGQAF